MEDSETAGGSAADDALPSGSHSVTCREHSYSPGANAGRQS